MRLAVLEFSTQYYFFPNPSEILVLVYKMRDVDTFLGQDQKTGDRVHSVWMLRNHSTA